MDIYERLISEPVRGLINRIVEFLPNIFSAVLILVFGLLAGWMTKLVLKKFLMMLKLDAYAERTGLTNLLAKSGLHEPLSTLLARITGGFIVLVFFVVSLSALNIEVIQRLIERLFDFLPNVFIALVVIVLGFILGNFLGRTALIASVNAGIKSAGAIGRSVKYLIVIVSVSMALENLGIGRDTVLVSSCIILSGIVLAFAIAFGLGGRDWAREFIEKKFKGEKSPDDIEHI